MEFTHAQASQISASTKDEILPVFRIGQRVRITKPVRNDGSNPFNEPNEILVPAGAEGYVKHIGDWLQVIRIYEVHFIEEGDTYGCREAELVAIDDVDGYDEVEEELRWIREHRAKKAAKKAAEEAAKQSHKEGE
ncbi:nitrogen fixation protein NifZ [Sulfurimonas sp. HSL3-7]|uniref:nitrogen fixation protein NifZ n=1 Tax=Sulfonitrofixus jiaomeiensis TaxID=3131938 RepID=UPI0031F9B8A6